MSNANQSLSAQFHHLAKTTNLQPTKWRSCVPVQETLLDAQTSVKLRKEHKNFWVVDHERGSEGGICKVWASEENAPRMDGNESQDRKKRIELNSNTMFAVGSSHASSVHVPVPIANNHGVTREYIPLGVDLRTGRSTQTAILLSNVLSPEECDRIVAVAESMGFKDDATVVLNRQTRQNQMLPWIMPHSLVNETIFKRIESLVPQSVTVGQTEQGKEVVVGPPVGINRRVHLYKYVDEGDHFKKHHDGSRSESPGLTQDQMRIIEDVANGSRHTFMTLLLYLDDGFTGGETEFFATYADVKVEPKKGSVLAFFHGDHPDSQLHAGCPIKSGKKTVAWCGLEYEVSQPRIV